LGDFRVKRVEGESGSRPFPNMKQIGVGLIGCGGIAIANHLPGLALCPQARVVALCDKDPVVLQKAGQQCGVTDLYADPKALLDRADVDAVILATPNYVHAPIALAAIAAGKHVMCEKPIAMNYREARQMYDSAEKAGVRHMTAFTYRFVPAMRYMAHLVKSGAVGEPYHFRVQRFQDWGRRGLGWRQVAAMAGTGELGDMLSHRIDYGHLLVGPIRRLVASTRRFIDDRGGQKSDLDDWVAVMAEFANGATGVMESSKLCSGRGEGGNSLDFCELNGSEGTLVYSLGKPHELQRGRLGGSGLESVPVPEEFLKWPGSPRDPHAGDPLVTFRYDQNFEFIDAILNQRPCRPSFGEGARVQAVMDAAVESAKENKWVQVIA
jgi:predicted dehydrogenase